MRVAYWLTSYFCLLLCQLSKLLSASLRQRPRSQLSAWDTGVGLGKGCRVRLLGRGIGQQAKELTSEEASHHPGSSITGIPRPHKSIGQ
jgi:hypothetical protein